MNPKTKDVEIKGMMYRIGKIDAMRGVWLKNLLVAEGQKLAMKESGDAPTGPNPLDSLTPEERAAGFVEFMWITSATQLDESLYRRIQQLCLQVIQAISPTANMPEPIVMANGAFTAIAQGLANDGAALDQLIIAVLQFNLSPFFVRDALNAPEAIPAQSSPNASK